LSDCHNTLRMVFLNKKALISAFLYKAVMNASVLFLLLPN